MILSAVVCGVLCVTVVALGIKVFLLRKSVREIGEGFSEKLYGDTNTPITVSSRDATVRKLARDINGQLRELRRQRQRYTQGDAALKAAVTNISHDIRTPLTAISGYLDLLEGEEKSEAVARYVGILKNRTQVLQSLTEELFRYSVVTSPEYGTKAERTDVKAVLEESVLDFYAVLHEKNIAPYIVLPQGEVIRHIDKAALQRVFSNLLQNVVKYSDGDLEIELTEDGTITFSNTAPALSEVQVERLFDRFYTVETARRSTGLGLSISRVLLRQMHGEITAEYTDGKLHIYILLPEH